MKLRGEGFLAESVEIWIEENKIRNADLFQHASGLRDLAVTLAQVSSGHATTEQEVTLVTLLLRAISSFEGVMLLSERGMLVEARTLTRNVYETAFYTGALVADEAFIGRMVADNAKHRKTLANELINDRAHSDVIGPDVLSQLAQFLMDLEASGQTLDRLISERAAKQAGMGPLYNFFRDLSGDAHPTIQSLNRYTDGQPDMTGFRLAPDDACVHLALAHAVPAMYACIMPLQPIFQAQAVFDKVTEHFRWFKDYRA